MKKIVSIALILSTYSFAVKDYMIKPDYNYSKTLYKVANGYPQTLDSQPESDDKNIFLYKGHFRVIFGKDYNSSTFTKNMANDILNIADNVWNKEITEYGFKPPKNSNTYYIDIYIGNKDAYNPEIGNVTISSYYCGYATSYNNQTPYFVMNPDMSLDLLKVTVAHEFFHTVQYAYGLDNTDYSIWEKNRWFLEASAVMMEDEVYDDVNDYINYLPSYFNNTNYPLEYANGDIEYGKTVFAKFLREKYGIDFIKKIFETYETNETVLEDIQKLTDFNKTMQIFTKWMANKENFKDGALFPNVETYTIDSNLSVYNYGFALIDENKNYFTGDNPEYLNTDYNNTFSVTNKMIFINPQITKQYLGKLNKNQYTSFEIKKGWNLYGNIFNQNIDLNSTFKNDEIVWIYRNNNYYAFSNNSNIQNRIKELNIFTDTLYSNEGFWIYSNKDENISINNKYLADNNFNFNNGWSLATFNTAFSPSEINATVIWDYNDNNWSYYSKEYNLSYKKIDYIRPLKGYFIKK